MTDEENNISSTTIASTTTTNNNNNKINNEHILAEAAKILLKNGLTGSNVAAAAAAAATLLSARTFPLQTSPRAHTAVAVRGKSAFQATTSAALDTTTAAATATSNGLSLSTKLHETTNTTKTATTPTTAIPTTTNSMAAVTAASATGLGTATPPTAQISIADVKGDMSVIDYTISSVNNINQKVTTSSSSDIGRHPISTNTSGCGGSGGRLQFYKDGKFILELARSKDGDKGGWVSVPRKLFRSPSTTSSTVTPSSAISTAYPKNESSTSLSFSDDNSSIQSSPWQRDHCWKQITPRRGISTEMALMFWHPKRFPRTASARHFAYKKRRRPLELIVTTIAIFECDVMQEIKTDNKTVPEVRESARSTSDAMSNEKSNTMPTKNGISGEEDGSSSSSSTATLTGNIETSELPVTSKPPISSQKDPRTEFKTLGTDESSVAQEEMNTMVEKMNTSENDDDDAVVAPINAAVDDSRKLEINGINNKLDETTAAAENLGSIVQKDIEKEGEEKRLRKINTRAKLSSIIQKLINRMPARPVHLSKTSMLLGGNSIGASNNSNNSLAQKIFPPTSATGATRLVEYHPQHVSPRKRILREFEKVSLEDNAVVAGGKRSRAKGNNGTTPQFRNTKSPPNRVQSSGCTLPIATATTASNVSEDHTNDKYCSNLGTSEKSKSVAPAAPTRLNSSYSIHSLLGGSNSNSSASSLSTAKRSGSEQAIVSSISFHSQQQQQMLQNYTDPTYLRAMLASPKSPERKSPNYIAGKRSPSYVSPMHEAHSRSPTVAHTGFDYGRRSPRESTPEQAISYKMRFPPEHGISPTTSHSQHSHHLQQHQGFYSPYMMSPKYVPAPSNSNSPNSNVPSSARATRHASAFNSTHSSLTASVSASTHIPNNFSSSGSIGLIAHRELSPPRSSTASPRESTPRTVPKKTASIRRRFASPTASNTSSSCTPPSDRVSEESVVQQDRKTPSHHMFHRGSPSAPLGPAPYYLYPTQANGSTASNTSVIPAVAATAAYIPSVVSPSYYHPYISTLAALRHNPMWMHHYSSSGPNLLPSHHVPTAASAAARLSPPFHSFPYNGVGAAVAAAAAAAAAFGGAQPSMPQTTHLPQSVVAHHHPHVFAQPPSALHGGLGLPSTGRTQFPKLTDNTEHFTTTTNTTTNTNTQTKAAPFHHCSIKDEPSSDVPLNLSKH